MQPVWDSDLRQIAYMVSDKCSMTVLIWTVAIHATDNHCWLLGTSIAVHEGINDQDDTGFYWRCSLWS